MVKNEFYYSSKEKEEELKAITDDNLVEMRAEFLNEFSFKVSFDRVVSLKTIDDNELDNFLQFFVSYQGKKQELKLGAITSFKSYF